MATIKKTIRKAQTGIKAKPTGDDRTTKNRETGEYSRLNRYRTPEGLRFYRSNDFDAKAARLRNDSLANAGSADSVRTKDLTDKERKHFNTQRSYSLTKEERQLKKGGKVAKAKSGKQMLKRADGSTSQRGLWDNIRAAKGSGKKPTAAMLKQERKIKSKTKK
jgi:hypothetical protein